MRTVLVVFPEPSSRWGGERLRKLCEPLPEYGWTPVFVASREAHAQAAHEGFSQQDWLAGRFVVGRAPDANPYVLGSRVKRLLARRREAGVAAGGGGAAASAAGRSRLVDALNRVWLPDVYAGWIPFAVAAGVRAARRHGAEAVFSSYPPASSHVAALLVARMTGLPWVADYRDPWADAAAHTYPTANDRAAALLERAVLRRADAVTAVGKTLAAALERRGARRATVVPQGFDAAPPAAPAPPHHELRLIHAGTLAAWPSNPAVLLRAAARVAAGGDPLVIDQLGPVFGCDAEVEEATAAGVLRLHEPVSRQEALRRVAAADVAVLIRSERGGVWVTTKLWDYLAARAPILALVDPASDAARIIEETRSGVVVPFDDEDAVEHALRRLARSRARPERDEAALAGYASPEVSRRLAELLDTVAAGHAA